MRIGVVIPVVGAAPVQPGLTAMGRIAEAAGADGLWVDDHLVSVEDPRSVYPYSSDGSPTWKPSEDRFEALTCCSWLASVTTTCRIGTAVLVLTQRNPLAVAKAAASLDRLSGGRFVLGIGIGWNRAEMEALGYQFESRGTRADEALRVLRECWSGNGVVETTGDPPLSQPVTMFPLPANPDAGIPILTGGMTTHALKRAARLGDGWLAVAEVSAVDLPSLETRVRALEAARRDAGTHHRPFEYVLKLNGHATAARSIGVLAADLQQLGFDELVLEPDWTDTQAAAEVIASTKDTVLGLV